VASGAVIDIFDVYFKRGGSDFLKYVKKRSNTKMKYFDYACMSVITSF
jgi:hypothetical protein